ncbi:ABC transporter permease subunit [Bacillus vallismortis]|uniref:Glutathione transport system permease protein GsiD n=1 Tax=Bacillus vallismortis TaxID=72361 RepID=A0AAP3CL52_BACVA|nr:ABC transporter permease subunit [Bacillus vallismortis]MBG9769332.1 glutathione ABC transporter permease [Bacillus vallismortis]MCI4138902.1 ABC transporter permease subunit [Bacillus vallismortis]MCY7894714.1 ABC transporter permease subunit [Bacillus vallismortis]MCY7916966.1 ABC transporter permease subunit [Bacillus vallismortis]MCY8310819.1 ABC transporter permease subunit [Bacillus vallismortis]
MEIKHVEKPAKSSRFHDFWISFKKQKVSMISAVFLFLLFFVALFGQYLVPYDPAKVDYGQLFLKPSAAHLAGTDAYGRDIFSRILVGARISLFVGLSSVFLGALAGSALGVISGYFGKWIDSLIMRFCDILLAFPGMLLAIGIIAILGTGLMNVVFAVAIFSVPVFARIVRSSVLEMKSSLYVEAAKSTGAKDTRIILKHILPGTFSTIIVYFTMRIGSAILIAAGLSFLGLGADPSTPEWGAMLSDGHNYLNTAPHVTIFPGLAIFLTVLAFNLLGDGLRDALDPKIKD